MATPTLAAGSRHAALGVPFGSASLQRSPPPALLTRNAIQCITRCNTTIPKSAMRKAQTTPLIRRQTNSRSTVCTFRIGSETREQLQAYADFIHSARSHVIREALRRLFCSDLGIRAALALVSNQL